MNAWVYSLIAALAAVGAEVWMKLHPDATWGQPILWPSIGLSVVINYGIWGTLQTESLLGLTILFSLFTASLRIAWTLLRGDVVSASVWAGFILVVIAGLVKALWR